jgi:hypothetical protein
MIRINYYLKTKTTLLLWDQSLDITHVQCPKFLHSICTLTLTKLKDILMKKKISSKCFLTQTVYNQKMVKRSTKQMQKIGVIDYLRIYRIKQWIHF